MRESQSREITVFHGKIGEKTDNLQQFSAQKFKTVAHLNEFSIVSNIAAGRTEMYYRHGGRALFPEHMDMAHYVVTQIFFHCFNSLEVDVIQMLAHLIELFIGYIKSELFFAFG